MTEPTAAASAPDLIGEARDDVRRAKEFLYVDIERARSYYAQLNRGVIDSIVSTAASSSARDGEAKLAGFGIGGGAAREASRQESRSLQDLTYVVLEESLQREGLLTDLGQEWTDADGWTSGRLHEHLHEGQVLRFTGDVQVLDPSFVRNRIAQVARVARAIAGVALPEAETEPPRPPARQGGRTHAGSKGKTAAQAREAQKDVAVAALLGGASSLMLEDIAEFVSGFTNDSIMVRAQPCGPARPELHFGGVLLSRSDYLQDDREALFSRYGSQPADWTVVMQVARIPTPAPPDAAELQPLTPGGQVDRVAVERMVSNLVTQVEHTGLAEGSAFPRCPGHGSGDLPRVRLMRLPAEPRHPTRAIWVRPTAGRPNLCAI